VNFNNIGEDGLLCSNMIKRILVPATLTATCMCPDDEAKDLRLQPLPYEQAPISLWNAIRGAGSNIRMHATYCACPLPTSDIPVL